jgi:hypothetical protein
MARWIIVGILAVAGGAPLCVAAQDRAVPPLLSPSPNAECQRQTLGLPPPALGETPGSASLSDQLSRSKGVICPPAGIDPGLAVPPVGGGITPVIPPPGTMQVGVSSAAVPGAAMRGTSAPLTVSGTPPASGVRSSVSGWPER